MLLADLAVFLVVIGMLLVAHASAVGVVWLMIKVWCWLGRR